MRTIICFERFSPRVFWPSGALRLGSPNGILFAPCLQVGLCWCLRVRIFLLNFLDDLYSSYESYFAPSLPAFRVGGVYFGFGQVGIRLWRFHGMAQAQAGGWVFIRSWHSFTVDTVIDVQHDLSWLWFFFTSRFNLPFFVFLCYKKNRALTRIPSTQNNTNIL